MNLVFLHGLPGVGKLTVARALAELTGYRVFHNHLTVDLVTSVFDFGTPAFRELREEIWLSVFRRAAREELGGLIFTFAFEWTVAEDFVGRVVEAVEAEGRGRVMFVSLRCDGGTLRERIAEPSRSAHGKLRSPGILAELMDAGDIFTRERIGRDDLLLDNTHLSPEEAARRVVEHFDLPARSA